MDITTAIEFLKYCSIINISILTFASILTMTSDFAYTVHTKLGVWAGSREQHKQLTYELIGNYKMLITVFNVVPYFALCYCI